MKKKFYFIFFLLTISTLTESTAQLQLTSPNGGEKFRAGSDIKIRWSGTQQTDEVKLQYSSNAGETWMSIADRASGNAYDWTLPRIKSNDMLVRAEKIVSENKGWAKHITGGPKVVGAGQINQCSGIDVITDSSGNIFVAGYFSGRLAFGEIVLESYVYITPNVFPPFIVNTNDIFFAKYNKKGEFLWVKRFGGLGDEQPSAIAADSIGNVYMTGFFGEGGGDGGQGRTADFGGITLKARNNYRIVPLSAGADIFVAKFDNNGNTQWVRRGGGGDSDYGKDIAVDRWGQVFVTGYFTDTADFGGHTYISAGSNSKAAGTDDIFITKYSPDGNVLWAYRAGGIEQDQAQSIALDNSGSIYITGSFGADAEFGRIVMQSRGGSDMFVAKYLSDGTFAWAKRTGAEAEDSGNSIAVDANCNIYVSGFFSESTDFEGITLTTPGYSNIFLVKFDSLANLQWVRQGGSDDENSNCNSLALDRSGNAYITGYFGRTAYFGSKDVISNGIYDVFITKYQPNGTVEWVTHGGGGSRDEGVGITVGNDDAVYTTGWFKSGDANFGSQMMQGEGYSDIFVWKLDPETLQTDVSDTTFFIGFPDWGIHGMQFQRTIVGSSKDTSMRLGVFNFGQLPVEILSASVIGSDSAHFSVETVDLPYTLLPGQSVKVDYHFTPKSAGIKSARFMVAIREGDTLDVSLWGEAVEQPVGIDEFFSEENFSFWPNPAKDFLRIKNTGDINEIFLLDMFGRKVRSWAKAKIAAEENFLDLGGIAAGEYFLSVNSESERKIFPLIIQ